VITAVVELDWVFEIKVLVEVEGSVAGSSAIVAIVLAAVLISVGSGGSVSEIVADCIPCFNIIQYFCEKCLIFNYFEQW
jgi:hypothetical protein